MTISWSHLRNAFASSDYYSSVTSVLLFHIVLGNCVYPSFYFHIFQLLRKGIVIIPPYYGTLTPYRSVTPCHNFSLQSVSLLTVISLINSHLTTIPATLTMHVHLVHYLITHQYSCQLLLQLHSLRSLSPLVYTRQLYTCITSLSLTPFTVAY